MSVTVSGEHGAEPGETFTQLDKLEFEDCKHIAPSLRLCKHQIDNFLAYIDAAERFDTRMSIKRAQKNTEDAIRVALEVKQTEIKELETKLAAAKKEQFFLMERHNKTVAEISESHKVLSATLEEQKQHQEAFATIASITKKRDIDYAEGRVIRICLRSNDP